MTTGTAFTIRHKVEGIMMREEEGGIGDILSKVLLKELFFLQCRMTAKQASVIFKKICNTESSSFEIFCK